MTRKISIKCCYDCHHNCLDGDGGRFCGLTRRSIADASDLPTWCPLPEDNGERAARERDELVAALRILTIDATDDMEGGGIYDDGHGYRCAYCGNFQKWIEDESFEHDENCPIVKARQVLEGMGK